MSMPSKHLLLIRATRYGTFGFARFRLIFLSEVQQNPRMETVYKLQTFFGLHNLFNFQIPQHEKIIRLDFFATYFFCIKCDFLKQLVQFCFYMHSQINLILIQRKLNTELFNYFLNKHNLISTKSEAKKQIMVSNKRR